MKTGKEVELEKLKVSDSDKPIKAIDEAYQDNEPPLFCELAWRNWPAVKAEIERLRERTEKLESALFNYAEWCDSTAKYKENKGGQHVGMPDPLQRLVSRQPSARRELRQQADYLLEILKS